MENIKSLIKKQIKRIEKKRSMIKKGVGKIVDIFKDNRVENFIKDSDEIITIVKIAEEEAPIMLIKFKFIKNETVVFSLCKEVNILTLVPIKFFLEDNNEIILINYINRNKVIELDNLNQKYTKNVKRINEVFREEVKEVFKILQRLKTNITEIYIDVNNLDNIERKISDGYAILRTLNFLFILDFYDLDTETIEILKKEFDFIED